MPVDYYKKSFRISFLFALRIVEEALFWQCRQERQEQQHNKRYNEQHNKQSVRKLDALLFIYH